MGMKWIRQFREANSHTKYFIFNWFLYGFMIIASTVYVYARLNYVRSTPLSSSQQEKQQVIEKISTDIKKDEST